MEIIFHSHANKTHFHEKGCVPSLILKVSVFGTRKWPIEAYLPSVRIEMKRKINLAEEEHESENEENESSNDESEDEEPRIKDVWSNLSQAVSKECASDLLHSMATS